MSPLHRTRYVLKDNLVPTFHRYDEIDVLESKDRTIHTSSMRRSYRATNGCILAVMLRFIVRRTCHFIVFFAFSQLFDEGCCNESGFKGFTYLYCGQDVMVGCLSFTHKVEVLNGCTHYRIVHFSE
jgi:hypothetical protein